MTSIGELFPKCRKLWYDARQQLSSIHRQPHILSEATFTLEELQRQLDTMEHVLLPRETPQQRTKWQHKIAELRTEATSMHQQAKIIAQQQLRLQYNNDKYKNQRGEVLHQRRRGNNNSSDMQQLAEESKSLENSQAAVLGLISQGEANRLALEEQRQRLRGVRGVMNAIDSSLGLTQSTMRIIERRDITDAYLVVAGMLITMVVLYVVWF